MDVSSSDAGHIPPNASSGTERRFAATALHPHRDLSQSNSSAAQSHAQLKLGSTTVSTSHFLRLPREIVETIAGYCWAESCSYTGAPGYYAVYGIFPSCHLRRASIKGTLALRLVCQEIQAATYRLFLERFFSEVSLIFTYKSLQRLLDISRHPVISKLPHTLIVGHHRLLTLSEIESNADSLFNARAFNSYFRNTMLPKLLKKPEQSHDSLPWDTEFLKQALDDKNRYLAALNQQTDLEESGADIAMLTAAFRGLSNIRALEIASSRPEPDRKQLLPWGEKELLCDAAVRDTESLMNPQPCVRLVNNTTLVASKVFTARRIARDRLDQEFASSYRGLEIDRLRIDTAVEFGFGLQLEHFRLGYPFDSLRACTLLGLLSGLKRLELTISPFGAGPGDRAEYWRRAVTALDCFLVSDLEELYLDLAESNADVEDPSSIWEMINDHLILRKLRVLSIRGCSLEQNTLATFVARHSATLQKFEANLYEYTPLEPSPLRELVVQLCGCSKLDWVDLAYNRGGKKMYIAPRSRGEVEEVLLRYVTGSEVLSDEPPGLDTEGA